MIHSGTVAFSHDRRATLAGAVPPGGMAARSFTAAWRTTVSLACALVLSAMVVSPAHAQTAAPARPDSTPARTNRWSWTSDRREFAVGDIITVLVDENTLASANKDNTATDTKSRTMKAGGDLPVEVGTDIGKSPSIQIESSNDGRSQQHGQAVRGSRFVSEISVRVVAVTKEGNLQVRGSKLVDVDKNKQMMTLTGFVRPEDVSTRNILESARIADAQLVYSAKGGLGKPKTGILTKILGVFWP